MIDLRIDTSSFRAVANRFHNAAEATPGAMNRAINHTGDKARTGVRVALVSQTGLKRKTINKAVTSTRASSKGGGSYVIKSKGGNIRLQFFGARETRAGVSAAPWNKRRIFGETFIKGGHFPNRVTISRYGGAVMYRYDGAGRFPIKVKKSGLFIAEEMVTGNSAQTFFTIVNRDLPARIAHELMRAL